MRPFYTPAPLRARTTMGIAPAHRHDVGRESSTPQLASAAHFNPRVDPNAVDPSLWPSCLDGWDGQSIDAAEALCGFIYAGGAAQAHLGMYAPPLLSRGDVYNDELYFYELQRL